MSVTRLPDLPLKEQIGHEEPGVHIFVGNAETITNGCWVCSHYALSANHDNHRTVGWIGWGGKRQEATAGVPLGIALARPLDGRIRRALWDVAYGYVNGFPNTAILYYLLTRTLPPRGVMRRILRWERRA